MSDPKVSNTIKTVSNTTSQYEEAQSELLTIRDYLRWSVSLFSENELNFGHGTDSAWDEAVNLILASLHLPVDMDHTVLDAKLLPSERQKLVELVRARVEDRVPVPYLTNEAWFVGLSFYVDKRVIIPRSPIGELIEDEFNPWVEASGVTRVLDMCTGSGCIAIATAMHFPDAIVDAVDLSEDALEVAKINVEAYDLEDRVNLIQSDVFSNLGDQRYDIIVSNPPYVAGDEYDNLPTEFSHEPQMSLLAEKQGLDIVHKILIGAEQRLYPKGILVCEVGFTQANLEAAYPGVPFTWLQFEKGGEGVFLLTCDELKEYAQQFIQSE